MIDNIKFSDVILGLYRVNDWNLSDKALIEFVNQCIDLGINTFDNANIYDNGQAETRFGSIINKIKLRRDQMTLISKCTIVYENQEKNIRCKYYDTSYEHIIQEVNQSLERLNTDYIDVLLLHRPDPLLDPNEVNKAFKELNKSGKVKAFGVSNYKPYDIELLQSKLDVPLITNQLEVSVLEHENINDRTISYCMAKDIQVSVWSPMAGGRLFLEESESVNRVKNALETVQEDVGCSGIDEVAYAWLATHPAKMPIIVGSGEIKYIHPAIKGSKIKLTKEQWFLIYSALKGVKIP